MDDLFLLVLAGHLLGDFVAQTDWQAPTRRRADEPISPCPHHATWWSPVWHD
jgi:hypothetical protein